MICLSREPLERAEDPAERLIRCRLLQSVAVADPEHRTHCTAGRKETTVSFSIGRIRTWADT